MARSLSKVQKKISKKRGGRPTALHENSRDAQRLRAASAREDKMSKILSAAHKSNQMYVDRVAWFQTAVEGAEGVLSDDELHTLTESYTTLPLAELTALKSTRRPNRPASTAETTLQSHLDADAREFKAGYWVPDIRDVENREKLSRWKGDWAGLNTLKFARVVKGGGVRESRFPPKGLS